jgi:hypothetical protein
MSEAARPARRSSTSFAAGARPNQSLLVRSAAVCAVLIGAIAAVALFPLRSEAPAAAKHNMGGWTYVPDRPADGGTVKRPPDATRFASPAEPVRDAAAAMPKAPGFGTYAVSGSRLFKLDVSPVRAPDTRVSFSQRIRNPAPHKLPSGRVKFIVQRAIGDANTFETAEIRLVARVARETSFDRSGRAVATFPEDFWVMRNISHPLRASPAKDGDGSYELRHDDPAFTLPPGRYALVLNEAVFDFAVEGQITDNRLCLERLAIASGVLHSECGETAFVN